MKKNSIKFAALNKRALEQIDSVMECFGLNGEQQGDDFLSANPNYDNAMYGSFSINIKTGQWIDFSEKEQVCSKGLISLYAYFFSVSLGAAMALLEGFLDSLDGIYSFEEYDPNDMSEVESTTFRIGQNYFTPYQYWNAVPNQVGVITPCP